MKRRRRQGVTLLEVLVAVMISGVGLLALLTLFPLGAMEMAMSVKDDRCGHAKHNASSWANILGLRQNAAVRNAMLRPDPTGNTLPYANALNASGQLLNPDWPSYPVYIDPLGYNFPVINPASRNWVAGLTFGAPMRMTYGGFSAPVPALLYPSTVLMDDIYFPRDQDANPTLALGTPCPVGNPYERTPRMSWAYLAQMPQVRTPHQVDLTIVIYHSRPVRPIDFPTAGENAFTATYYPLGSAVSVGWTANPPEVAVGTWVMDVNMTPGPPRANFHRVVNVTQTGPNSMDLDLLPPPRGGTGPYNGTLIVMENVVEVYFRGDY